MAKWHAYSRCKTRLARYRENLFCKRAKKMTEHTVKVAKSIEKKGLIDISLAISGVGMKRERWSSELGIKNFNLQGKGCLEKDEKANSLK